MLGRAAQAHSARVRPAADAKDRRDCEGYSNRRGGPIVASVQLNPCSYIGTEHFNLRAVRDAFNFANRARLHFMTLNF